MVTNLIVVDTSLKEYWVVNGVTGAVVNKIPIPGGGGHCGFQMMPDFSGEYILGCTNKKLYYLVNDAVTQTIDVSATNGAGGLAMNPTGAFMYISGTQGLVLDTAAKSGLRSTP